jgi:hypothetical protein
MKFAWLEVNGAGKVRSDIIYLFTSRFLTNQMLGERFLFKWVQACALPGTLLVLAFTISILVWSTLRIPITGAIILLAMGIAVGIAQYRVLKPHLTRTRRWFFGTVIGTAVAIAIFIFVPLTFSSDQLINIILSCAVPLILSSAITGFLQYFLLSKHFLSAIIWAFTSTLSVVIAEVVSIVIIWILTFALSFFLPFLVKEPVGGQGLGSAITSFGTFILLGYLVSPVGIYAGFAVYGAITGAVLVRLLRQGGVTERN